MEREQQLRDERDSHLRRQEEQQQRKRRQGKRAGGGDFAGSSPVLDELLWNAFTSRVHNYLEDELHDLAVRVEKEGGAAEE